MRHPLNPVLETLAVPVLAFVRDDDAGWDDASLFALLDTVERAGAPIDLAAIPTAMHAGLARELRARIASAAVGVHQHGCAHANHERAGRRCEFGADRSAEQQRDDITRGRTLLLAHFAEALQPMFTPPWNRCDAHTPRVLSALGFGALSRDRGATPVQTELPELPVDVDWSRAWRRGGAPAVIAALAAALQARAADGRPLGLMLHHAAMGADERALLATLLAPQPGLHWRPMRACLLQAPPVPCDSTV